MKYIHPFITLIVILSLIFADDITTITPFILFCLMFSYFIYSIRFQDLYYTSSDKNRLIDMNDDLDILEHNKESLLMFKQDGKFGLIKGGKEIIAKPEYSFMWRYNDDYFIARNEKYFGAINKEGKIVIEFVHKEFKDIEYILNEKQKNKK